MQPSKPTANTESSLPSATYTANAESNLPCATAKLECPRQCRALRPNLPNLLFAKYIAYSYMWYQLYSLTLQLRSYIYLGGVAYRLEI